ncbi:fungal hydrophobin-domain-containing protein [Xylariaceae sp. FL1651]|nr:fungal hydrophobin-domain-containing protein [Xylariaceae sp. FL1651]
MQISILFATLLATAVVANPLGLPIPKRGDEGGYPTSTGPGSTPTSTKTPSYPSSSSTSTPGGGYPTSSPTSTPGGGYPTSSSSTPGGGGSGYPTGTSTSPSSTPTGGGGGYDACPDGLYSVPQCCATDVLGIADLDCQSPAAVPSSPSSFQSICATGGQRARCCVIPVLNQAALCETPVGV